jgi:Na+-transporting NADH:ubiquinone oxidoreductase subunit NqrC
MVSNMFGFESILMQAVAVPAGDLVSQTTAFVGTLSVLTSTIVGIIVYVIQAKNSIQKKELSERDKQILEIAKSVQIGMQKGAETIGSSKEVIQMLYESNVSPEERKKLEEKVGPILERENIRLQKANEQAVMVKAKMVELLGQKADVDQDASIPRESAAISAKLRNANVNIVSSPTTVTTTTGTAEGESTASV